LDVRKSFGFKIKNILEKGLFVPIHLKYSKMLGLKNISGQTLPISYTLISKNKNEVSSPSFAIKPVLEVIKNKAI
jgi:hypothetical protein